MAKLIKRYDYERFPGEINSGESLVEEAGYIPADVKIESMIDAGRRLSEFRAGYEFTGDEEIPDDYLDVTRNPNYDLADASNDVISAIERMKATPQVVPEESVTTPPIASESSPKA